MNWEALAAISEAAGALAIFVSLIYVAVQIRQNTQQYKRTVETSELAAIERSIESANRARELLFLHPEVSELLLKGFKGQSNLKSVERFRFGMLMRNLFNSIQGAYLRQLVMEHDSRHFEGGKTLLDDFLVNRGVREWLESNTPDWRPEFRTLVEERLESYKARTVDAEQNASNEALRENREA